MKKVEDPVKQAKISQAKKSEKISRASHMILESIKETLVDNVMRMTQSGNVKLVDQESLHALLAIIGSSVDAGYHKSHRTFMRMVDDALNAKE